MNIVVLILLGLSAVDPLLAQTLDDLVPDVVAPSYGKSNSAYQEFELERIRSGEKTFDRVTSLNPLAVTVTFSFDSEYNIFEVIRKVEEYGLNVVGYHHHLGGSHSFPVTENQHDEVESYIQYMRRMSEAMITTYEPMANDKFFSRALRADAMRQLQEFKSLLSTLNGDAEVQIIGVDVKGEGKVLRRFVSENTNLSKAKEVVFPGRRFGAISPFGSR